MSVPDIKQAIRLIEREEWEEVVQLLEQWIQTFPIYPSPYVLLARIMEHHNRLARAYHLYQELRFLVPRSPVMAEGLQRVVARLRQQETLPRWETLHRSWVVRPVLEPPSPAEPTLEMPAEAPSETASPPGEPSPVPETPPAPETVAETDSEAFPAEFDVQDLDTLIEQLEEARIVPEPDFNPETPVEPVDEGVAPEVVSETLALIYEAQGQYEQAAEIYERLAIKYPERMTEFLQKAVQTRLKASGTSSA